MYLSIPADHRKKIKENGKIDKYLDLARDLRKLWNVSVAVIPTVSGALGTVPKGLIRRLDELEIKGRIKTIQINALLRSYQRYTEESPGNIRRLAVTQTPV